MRIAELAARTGVKVSTIRFYERAGVLEEPPRTPGGYRDYGDESVRFVRFLKRGQALGFSLAELASFAQISSEVRAGFADPTEVSAAAAAKLDDLDTRIADLQRTRHAVQQIVAEPCLDPGARCPIIGALAGDGV